MGRQIPEREQFQGACGGAQRGHLSDPPGHHGSFRIDKAQVRDDDTTEPQQPRQNTPGRLPARIDNGELEPLPRSSHIHVDAADQVPYEPGCRCETELYRRKSEQIVLGRDRVTSSHFEIGIERESLVQDHERSPTVDETEAAASTSGASKPLRWNLLQGLLPVPEKLAMGFGAALLQ